MGYTIDFGSEIRAFNAAERAKGHYQMEVDAAKQALDEHRQEQEIRQQKLDEDRKAAEDQNQLAIGESQAQMGDLERRQHVGRVQGFDKMRQMIQPGAPSIEQKTQGLVNQQEMDQTKLLAERMSSPKAKTAFLSERLTSLQERIVDQQEQASIGELSRTLAAIAQTVPHGAEEFAPRYQSLGQAFDAIRHLPPQQRAAAIADLMGKKSKLDEEFAAHIKETKQREDAIVEFTARQKAIPDKNSEEYNQISDVIVALTLGAKPADALKAYTRKREGKMPVVIDGVEFEAPIGQALGYLSRRDAEQKRAEAAAAKAAEENRKHLADEAETNRKNKAGEDAKTDAAKSPQEEALMKLMTSSSFWGLTHAERQTAIGAIVSRFPASKPDEVADKPKPEEKAADKPADKVTDADRPEGLSDEQWAAYKARKGGK